MGLNPRNGDMYDFIAHAWNTVKGKFYNDFSYCYMKISNKNQREEHIDKDEFKTDLTKDKFIFLGSGIDLFARNIPSK